MEEIIINTILFLIIFVRWEHDKAKSSFKEEKEVWNVCVCVGGGGGVKFFVFARGLEKSV